MFIRVRRLPNLVVILSFLELYMVIVMLLMVNIDYLYNVCLGCLLNNGLVRSSSIMGWRVLIIMVLVVLVLCMVVMKKIRFMVKMSSFYRVCCSSERLG